MSDISVSDRINESIFNIRTTLRIDKTGKKEQKSNSMTAKKETDTDKFHLFCHNYGNFSLISFGH